MTPALRRRIGFTLVELLVVITILGVLVALLVPAITGAVRRARQAQAEAQINTLAGALASFKAKYGEFPPSRLFFHESGRLGTPPTSGYYDGFLHAPDSQYPDIGGRTVGPAANSRELSELTTRSLLALRSIFPKANFNNTSYVDNPTSLVNTNLGGFYDINGNGIGDDDPILLDGHECLYLFLCGVPDWGTTNNGFSLRGAGGFDVNPRNPFQVVPAAGPDASRSTPFFEITSPSQLSDDDRDGVPGIVDPIGATSDARYVAYFSSTFGGYDPRDVQLSDPPDADDDSTDLVVPSSQDFWLPGTGPVPDVLAPNPWTISTSDTVNEGPRWFRPQSFQLLSPGSDRRYGPGGQVVVQDGSMTYPEVPGSGGRLVEEDNVGMR